jgi:hypothetical protein
VSDHIDARVSLEPTEVQKLRLQLVYRECQLNEARRNHMEAELRIHQSVIAIANATVPDIETQLVYLERERKECLQRFAQVTEQIKSENGWPSTALFDGTTLQCSAPAEHVLALSRGLGGEDKIRIH